MDRTALFQQCSRIYQEEFTRRDPSLKQRQVKTQSARPKGLSNGVIDDNGFSRSSQFVQTSQKLSSTIDELSRLLLAIQTDYLLWNSKTLTDLAKDEIDSTFKLQLSVLHKKLQTFQKSAQTLNESMQVTNGASLESLSRNLASMGEYGHYMQIVCDTVCQMRLNVVKALGIRLTKVSDSFVELSNRRRARKLEQDRSYLATNDIYSDISATTDYVADQGVTDSFRELDDSLEPQQLQQLTKENENLQIHLKNENLKSVTHMESSVIEISSMINEISLQLNLQNESINTLADYQDDILSNVNMGNKQLVKANERARNSGRNLSFMIMAISIILLMIDYIL
ncbi:hypothetical protein FOA43_001317 [Brettanomyces nanus]|uniref:t-SNARE coiled-coil homology domain-containing protein n=1 Tax=Eeniella nana TaxID=13502 RepID=A0A875RNP7_EENNA|nr:uncharacterized protein FOA43_001317 [Brettanomyces nanus]QPG74000.1 hypothetical protein FOA43_001317 [Brettanomyces nanus]